MKTRQLQILRQTAEAIESLTEAHGADRRWKAVHAMLEAGNVEGAANLCCDILLAKREEWSVLPLEGDSLEGARIEAERVLASVVMSAVMSVALETGQHPNGLATMACVAADLDFPEFYYDAANCTKEIATSPGEFRAAERYYLKAIESSQSDAVTAAALVNYCEIVRDGLITGTPDWPQAVQIYERAANMGLIKGMFNAGNVSLWLASEGVPGYAERAAQWFKILLDFRSSHRPHLDWDDESLLQEVEDQATCGLAGLHINGSIESADLDAGILLVEPLARLGDAVAKRYLEIAKTRRFSTLGRPSDNTPANNWRYVLEAIGWRFEEGVDQVIIGLEDGKHAVVEALSVDAGEWGQVAVFVLDASWVTLNMNPGQLRQFCESVLNARAVRDFSTPSLWLMQRSLFVESEGDIFTPIYCLGADWGLSRQSLHLEATPASIVANAKAHVEFMDSRYCDRTCVISIAVNTLDEGGVLHEDLNLGSRWAGIGSRWRMPFLRDDYPTKLQALQPR